MSRETWQEQLRRGSLDLAILLTVSEGPRYGLAIIQHLEAFTDLVVTERTISPSLRRRTRAGLAHARAIPIGARGLPAALSRRTSAWRSRRFSPSSGRRCALRRRIRR